MAEEGAGPARDAEAVTGAEAGGGLHVVLAEPATVADTGPRGPNRLYVALTRAVSRLDVLHTRPLPPELRTAP
ncbi:MULTISPECIES: hypothetical protein [Streptomyces]|uniref:UvrD-like helicase C-terminal domain-containing protein n=1 Tax=Streptomyces sudanensis TaxID=436397 RepID=A0ABY4TML9_9ACTN|nr:MULTISPECIES: hypothetical protein [Streptomyces]URN18938.1 hypothetical protein MW084_12885 [Streptomyces sudanensis]